MPQNEDQVSGSVEGLPLPAQARKARTREHIEAIARRRAPVEQFKQISKTDRKTGQRGPEEISRVTLFEPQGSDGTQFLSPWCA